jgi:phospholipase/carboxylesterase
VTRVLDYGTVPALSGQADSMVIFLHGYGADGADLLGLADSLKEHLPDTVFLAPNAPERSAVNPMGYQWFPIPWIDGSSEEEAMAGMARAVADLNAFLDRVMDAHDMLAEQVALVGFSQGTMMSLYVAPRRDEALAGVVGFSGRLLAPEALADEVRVRPPILLIHGDRDDVVPPEALSEAAEALEQAGFTEVYAHVMRGTGHGIAPDGLGVALAFLRQAFGLERGGRGSGPDDDDA